MTTDLDTWLKSQSGRCPTCAFHIATQGCRCPGGEWAIFTAALRSAAEADEDGRVHQRNVRPLIRGRIQPKRIGLFYKRAKSTGLLVMVGKEPSNDRAGRNEHHDSPIYELRGVAA